MNNSTRKHLAETFTRNLDRRLRKALLRAAELASRKGIVISVEIFFAALLNTSGGALRKHFKNVDALALPEKSAGHSTSSLETSRTATTSNLSFVGLETQLSQLLWDAIRISKAMRHKSAGLEEFVAAFCLNDAIVVSFEEKKGVLPVNFLKGPSGTPQSEE